MRILILRNLDEICVHMGVGRERVKRWARQGAPIAIEGFGRQRRYSAEAGALQAWREKRRFA